MTVAQVKLWGTTIGAVSISPSQRYAQFEYDTTFLGSGIQIAPLTMPLAKQVYQFPSLALESFHGLPGLLADALPDKWGNAIIDKWLADQGRTADSFNAVERLCYTGQRAMGALEFSPASGPRQSQTPIEIDALRQLASDILANRGKLSGSLKPSAANQTMRDILRIGTSAGGARAKAVIAWNPNSGELRSGQTDTETGFEHWLLKFDGVEGNGDRELADAKGYSAIEYAYHLMALDAGINMTPCRLLEENGRRHFMTKRFDRLDNGEKLHMQSLGAIAHYDFNMAGAYSYEQACLVMRQLNLPIEQIEQLFRRMIFNIVARNQDDHVKNIAFLMNKQGQWSLAPAYDVVYSYQPDGRWTSQHQMSINNKRDEFTLADLNSCAKKTGLKQGYARRVLEEVSAIVSQWPQYAAEAGVPEAQIQGIKNALRLNIK